MFFVSSKKRMTKCVVYNLEYHWNSNIPITQSANSHKSETLLPIPNTSPNPKLFSQTETLLTNRNTSRPHRDLNPGLIAPQFTALSTRPLATCCYMRRKKSKFKLLIIIRYLEIRVMKRGLMRQLGNIRVTMSRGCKLVGIIGVLYKPA